MTLFEKLRLYHAALALSALAAYLTGEAGLIHAWLGYLVLGIIVFRVLWGLVGPRQLGIVRLFPALSEVAKIRAPDHPAIGRTLLFAVAVSLIVTAATGAAMDGFASLPGAGRGAVAAEEARGAAGHDTGLRLVVFAEEDDEGEEDENEGVLSEVHEASANLFLICVGLHAGYLLLFKRKFALLMLFFGDKGQGGRGAQATGRGLP